MDYYKKNKGNFERGHLSAATTAMKAAVKNEFRDGCSNDKLDQKVIDNIIAPEFWRRYSSMKANRTACCRKILSNKILSNKISEKKPKMQLALKTATDLKKEK